MTLGSESGPWCLFREALVHNHGKRPLESIAAPTMVVCSIACSNFAPAAEQIRISPRSFFVRHLPLPLSWINHGFNLKTEKSECMIPSLDQVY